MEQVQFSESLVRESSLCKNTTSSHHHVVSEGDRVRDVDRASDEIGNRPAPHVGAIVGEHTPF